MSKIEFPLPDWEYGVVDLGDRIHFYDRDNPMAYVESDTTVKVKP